jgi:hypothetical protein
MRGDLPRQERRRRMNRARPVRQRNMSIDADLSLSGRAVPLRIERQPRLSRDTEQPLVAGPKLCARGEQYRGKQMDVHISDATPEPGMPFNDMQHFRCRGDGRTRQARQCVEHDVAPPQIAQGKFPDHKRMGQHQSAIKQIRKRSVPGSQVRDPD